MEDKSDVESHGGEADCGDTTGDVPKSEPESPGIGNMDVKWDVESHGVESGCDDTKGVVPKSEQETRQPLRSAVAAASVPGPEAQGFGHVVATESGRAGAAAGGRVMHADNAGNPVAFDHVHYARDTRKRQRRNVRMKSS